MYRANYSLWTDNGIFDAVQAERDRQDAKWGVQHWPDGTNLVGDDGRMMWAKYLCEAHAREGTVTWREILDEEVKEAFAETEWSKLRTELVQCMAVIAAWIEDGDSRSHESDTSEMDNPKYAAEDVFYPGKYFGPPVGSSYGFDFGFGPTRDRQAGPEGH